MNAARLASPQTTAPRTATWTVVAALAAWTLGTGLLGCTPMQPEYESLRAAPREPGIVVSSSELTREGGLRILAKVETGTYRLGKASIAYSTNDPGQGAPVDAGAKGSGLQFVKGTSEAARVDRDDREVSFSLDRRALGDLGNRALWYRWTVTLDAGGGNGRVVQSAFYRTSRLEAGLPRDAYAPGPDTSIQIPGSSR